MLETLVFKWQAPVAIRKYLYGFLFVFCIVPILLGIVFFVLNAESYMEVYSRRDYGLFDRLKTEVVALAFYLKMMLLPVLSDMSLYHDAFPIVGIGDPEFLVSLLLLSSMLVMAWLVRERAPLISIGVGLFFISHILESTFLPLELVFEHRNYFALLGVLIPIIWYVSITAHKLISNRLVLVAPFLFIPLTVSLTHARAWEWGDNIRMHVAAVEHKPQSLRALTAYAIALSQEGRSDQAIEQYRRAMEIDRDDAYWWLAILNTRCVSKQFDSGDYQNALVSLKKSKITKEIVTVLSDLVSNHKNGICSRPNTSDLLALFEVADEIKDSWLSASEQAILLAYYGLLKYQNGEITESIALLKRSFSLDQSNATVLLQLSAQQIIVGQIEDAIRSIQQLEIINAEQSNRYDRELREIKQYYQDSQVADLADENLE
jgi:hypothetical protein